MDKKKLKRANWFSSTCAIKNKKRPRNRPYYLRPSPPSRYHHPHALAMQVIALAVARVRTQVLRLQLQLQPLDPRQGLLWMPAKTTTTSVFPSRSKSWMRALSWEPLGTALHNSIQMHRVSWKSSMSTTILQDACWRAMLPFMHMRRCVLFLPRYIRFRITRGISITRLQHTQFFGNRMSICERFLHILLYTCFSWLSK